MFLDYNILNDMFGTLLNVFILSIINKNYTIMKILNNSIALFAVSIILYSCDGGNKTTVTEMNKDSVAISGPGMADSSNKDMKTTTASTTSAEQDFINYAVPKNTKEIMWLNAGTMKGNKEIKNHSAMMLKDHNKLAMQIKDWMSRNTSIMMPALDTANEVNINEKMGNDWNKAWVEKSIADHIEILDHLKSAKTAVTNADLNKIITKTIPIVESHLKMSNMMREAVKK